MISKQTEYKSEVLKIAGFAMLTPFGSIFLSPMQIIKDFGFLYFLGYFIFGLIIGTSGLRCILRGCELLSDK